MTSTDDRIATLRWHIENRSVPVDVEYIVAALDKLDAQDEELQNQRKHRQNAIEAYNRIWLALGNKETDWLMPNQIARNVTAELDHLRKENERLSKIIDQLQREQDERDWVGKK
jgi:DNA mismatch repair ATPase MutS